MNNMLHTENSSNLNIIVIDDNPSIHQDFIKILSYNQDKSDLEKLDSQIFGKTRKEDNISLPTFKIDTASQGQEGVKKIAKALEEGQPYSLAFVDIRMPPGWDGIETIKHIWELDKDIQIVICTAYSDYTWEETISELGMQDNLLILNKPFDNVSVRQLACALTKKWQLMQESRIHLNSLERIVSERTDSLKHSFSLIRSTLESSYDGIAIVDNHHKLIDFNNRLSQIWKFPDTLLTAKDFLEIQNFIIQQLKYPKMYTEKIEEIKLNNDEKLLETLRLKDNRVIEVYTQANILNEKPIGRIWSFRDISKRVQLEEELEYQATHDLLTNLPNRALLYDRIKQEMAISDRQKKSFALLFFDLDRFKIINDSLGHKAGDLLLQIVAKRLQQIIRSSDTVARLGGDEFVLLSPGLKKNEDVIHITEKILETIKEPILIEGREILITASIGVSIYPSDGKNIEELLSNADLAMYRAKEEGRAQFQYYTKEMNEQCKSRLEKESELRAALANEDFFLTYQPQFDSLTNALVGVEALIRWNHPKQGVLLPIDFIPFAEECGLIVPLGEWVFKTACKQNKIWQEKGFPPIRVAVNVTTQQFMQPHFSEDIFSILKEVGLKPEFLEIEVTENVIITHHNVVKTIHKLKEGGLHIVLDDFGTGNSSLNYLRTIPIDRLKIDKSFVQSIDASRSDEVIIQAIISMAKSLDLDVIAEGVEQANQVNFLQKQHCKGFQGFLFSKPLLPIEIEKIFCEKAKNKN